MAALGSQTYGNPVVAGGMVFVGTNNEVLRDPKQAGDRGVLMAFRESDGEFLWQHTHEKLAAGRVNDWPYQGVCSSPLVEGDRLYYVSNRGELLALDTQGFRDGENDGPVHGREAQRPRERGRHLAVRHDGGGRRLPAQHGELLPRFLRRPHLRQHVERPGREPRPHPLAARARPSSPSTRTPASSSWEDNSVGEKILHGQWASPTVGKIGGVDQVIMGQGDGWVRGYEALTGKKLWEFDTNPKDSVWPKTRNELISTAVI